MILLPTDNPIVRCYSVSGFEQSAFLALHFTLMIEGRTDLARVTTTYIYGLPFHLSRRQVFARLSTQRLSKAGTALIQCSYTIARQTHGLHGRERD